MVGVPLNSIDYFVRKNHYLHINDDVGVKWLNDVRISFDYTLITL